VSFVVSLEGFVPPPRYDALPWTHARIEQSTTSATGPWTSVATPVLSPVDADPTNPQARNFTVTVVVPTAWYRVVWLDAANDESDSSAIYSDQTSYQSSGVNFGTLVSRLRGMTAVDPDEAKARINQAHKRMCAEAEALKARITVGVTIVGEDTYELDPDIVQLLSLRVDGHAYERKSMDELDDLGANDAWAYGYPQRYFAPEFSAIGGGEVAIWPVPTSAGLTITGRAAMLPPDLVNDADYPSLPADFHEDLVDGAMATVLRRDDERFAEADAIEARFLQRCRDLRGRLNKRVGSGPVRIAVVR
jgi:hypothetical protein